MSKLTFVPKFAGVTRIAVWHFPGAGTSRHSTTFRPDGSVSAVVADAEVVQTSGIYRVPVFTRYRSFSHPFVGREGVPRSALITLFA
jgi:hypothetical protein